MAGTRGKQSVRNMLQSLAVIGIAVAVIYMFVPHDENKDPNVKAIDYRVELLTARRAAPYPVAAPVGLPDQDKWKATSVTFDGKDNNAWHLGFLDPDTQYVGIEQSSAPDRDKFVASVAKQAKKTDHTQQIAGATWRRWDGPKYNALVREDKGSTTVVTGTAPFAQLEKVAAALELKKS
ncbi:DUF4245 domain-containing protein [Streptomyces sp. BR1]|uniref:DUF4245 domain-containing protein n=1 Tax=Streptomyces sp. BR1 TaxID=1592323 RepID=UPI00402B44A8